MILLKIRQAEPKSRVRRFFEKKDMHGNTRTTLILDTIAVPVALWACFVVLCATIKFFFF